MYAFVTGASSGIGRDIARLLRKNGYDLIITARREDRLRELADELGDSTVCIPCDLSKKENCLELCRSLNEFNVEIAVNNAGFGLFGEFIETDLDNELDMININIKALHILTKYFTKRFVECDKGYILNVASIAGFMQGPLMATYYATKSYVIRLTAAVAQEAACKSTAVRYGLLCPGPVDTEFNSRAGVSFGLKSMTSEQVAEYAVKKMLGSIYQPYLFTNLQYMFPNLSVRLAVYAAKFSPSIITGKVCMNEQHKKKGT